MERQPPSEGGDIDDRDEAPGHEQPERHREQPRRRRQTAMIRTISSAASLRRVAPSAQTGAMRASRISLSVSRLANSATAGDEQRQRVERRRDGECALEDARRELLELGLIDDARRSFRPNAACISSMTRAAALGVDAQAVTARRTRRRNSASISRDRCAAVPSDCRNRDKMPTTFARARLRRSRNVDRGAESEAEPPRKLLADEDGVARACNVGPCVRALPSSNGKCAAIGFVRRHADNVDRPSADAASSRARPAGSQ